MAPSPPNIANPPLQNPHLFPLIKNLANGLFPNYCDLCQRLLSDAANTSPGLCLQCRGELARNHFPCKICAAPETGGSNRICGRCQLELGDGHSFLDQTFAPYLYENGIAELIQRFKYNRKLYLAGTFSRLLLESIYAAGIEEELASATLMPVPLHTSRLRSRGYNQTLEIAKVLQKSQALRLTPGLLPNAIERTRATRTQTGLSFARRAANVKNAFVTATTFSGTHIVLLDDVMTTGSTIKEIAKVLKQSGAAKVSALVVARA